MVKSHDFDGKELFKPRSSGKTHVAKGNMQVEEYLYRDAKVSTSVVYLLCILLVIFSCVHSLGSC